MESRLSRASSRAARSSLVRARGEGDQVRIARALDRRPQPGSGVRGAAHGVLQENGVVNLDADHRLANRYGFVVHSGSFR
jgi:hypothetical protein